MRRRLSAIGVTCIVIVTASGTAQAQQEKMQTIGFLHIASPASVGPRLDAFRNGLRESGFLEARNLTIEYRWAEGQSDRLPALAKELIDLRVSVLVAGTSPGAVAAKNASSTVPIVFTGVGGDPIKLGLVDNINRPGGNVTGIAMMSVEVSTKRLQILSELVPRAETIAVLTNPKNPNAVEVRNELRRAAERIGRTLVFLQAGGVEDLPTAFSQMQNLGVGALVVEPDSFFYSQRKALVALAASHRLPAIYEFRDSSEIGGLVSYAPDANETYRLAGGYAGRVLRGELPSELPVQLPLKFDLIINSKTANSLGIEIPLSLLSLANEVIE